MEEKLVLNEADGAGEERGREAKEEPFLMLRTTRSYTDSLRGLSPLRSHHRDQGHDTPSWWC
jgi:hypothetical protein